MRSKNTLITIVSAVVILLQTGSCFAQRKMPNNPNYDKKAYHFGFMLGLNEMDFILKRKQNFQIQPSLDNASDVYSIDAIPEKGFNVGIIANLRLNKNFDLRFVPDLAFGDRSILFKFADTLGNLRSVTKKIESTYVEFPLLIKYKGARQVNARPYLIAGPKLTLDLASQAKKKKKDELEDEDIIKLKRNDVAAEIGVGFDFYLRYFKFATEIKMSYGLTDILKKETTFYPNSIESLHSKIFMISFLFE